MTFERRNFVLGSWSTKTNGRSKKKIYTITQNGEVMLRECLSTLAITKEELAV
jgi:DNA-binding PadR family transcriptional regulator